MCPRCILYILHFLCFTYIYVCLTNYDECVISNIITTLCFLGVHICYDHNLLSIWFLKNMQVLLC